MFELSIGDFHLSTRLWVIWSSQAMCDSISFEHFLNLCITEMCASITNKCSWCTKSREESLEKFHHYTGIVCWQSLCFYPLGNIIHSHKNVFITKEEWKWSHEINPPNIKYFTLHNVVLWHFI